MYIEFKLPQGAGGMAAHHFGNRLRERVQEWAKTHNVTVKYTYQGYRIVFIFERDSDYTLFALSWTAPNQWFEYSLVYSKLENLA